MVDESCEKWKTKLMAKIESFLEIDVDVMREQVSYISDSLSLVEQYEDQQAEVEEYANTLCDAKLAAAADMAVEVQEAVRRKIHEAREQSRSSINLAQAEDAATKLRGAIRRYVVYLRILVSGRHLLDTAEGQQWTNIRGQGLLKREVNNLLTKVNENRKWIEGIDAAEREKIEQLFV